MWRQLFLAGVLGVSVNAAHAAFSYNYVEGGFGEVDEGDALFVSASKSVNNNVFVLGSVYAGEFEFPRQNDVDGFYVEGGLGYAMPLNSQTDFFANAQLLYADADEVDDDIGGIARAGLRFVPLDKVELEASAAWSANDLLVDDGLGMSASARYYFAPRMSAALGFSSDTELDGPFVSVRYNFQ